MKMSSRCSLVLSLTVLTATVLAPDRAFAQPLGRPDRESPGDEMIQAYLQHEATRISSRFDSDVKSLDDWQAKRPRYGEEYFYMLGLSPRPEKTPLDAKTTGTIEGEGYVVEKLHYQSRPGLYVTGNLYRPAPVKPDEKVKPSESAKAGEKLPAIFYVCGHSGRGRNGNKVAYQSHGIWFARHGFICLVVDSLQLGEIAATHHGTYNLQRWWWHSRGYTPAGVECFNGIRGIDYLVGRPDVDAERIAVTGISGGGAATFWVVSADERVKVAVPVSGMADLEAYVPNRVINGHCDCMFLYNTFQWPWTRIAALVAPRPMLFVNSDQDAIFPMDANERISNRLERLYSLFGAGDQFDVVVSVGGHAYRKDIRQAAFRFINAHLKGDFTPVGDSEIDLVSEGSDSGPYPIAPDRLRVFPTDLDLPTDQLNTTIDEHFVPLADVAVPEAGGYNNWKQPLLAELRRVSFGYFPETIPPATVLGAIDASTERVQSEERIEYRLRYPAGKAATGKTVLLAVLNEDEAGTTPAWLEGLARQGQVVLCEPRGTGETRWTRKNGPNYVERSHVLLGRTVDAGRVWDVIAAARYLAARFSTDEIEPPVFVAGKGAAGVVAAYAAVLDEQIAGAKLISPPTTHMDKATPQLLNVLRVCDVPDVLGMLAPRPLAIVGTDVDGFQKTTAIYSAAKAGKRLTFE